MDLKSPTHKSIFLSIFKHLEINDRKNARRTCNAWNAAGNSPEIVEREKYVFYVGNFGFDKEGVELTGKSLSKCKNLRSDFEFHELPLHLLPAVVWKQIGGSVESLLLNNCEVDDETIGTIIFHCSILKSFHIKFDPSASERYIEKKRIFLSSDKTLRDLIKSKLVQKNLVSLQLFIGIEILEKICPKLYQIYPNIQSFGTNIQVLGYLHTKKALGKFPPKMTSLTYFVETDTIWMVPFCENSKFELRELKLRIDFETCDVDLVKKFFSTQTALERINFLLCGNPSLLSEMHGDDAKEIIFLILQKCSKLRVLELEVRDVDEIHLTGTEFTAFLNEICRLEVLSLKVSGIFLDKSNCNDELDDSFSRSTVKDNSFLGAGVGSSSLSAECRLLKLWKLTLMFEHSDNDFEEFILTILKLCCVLQSLSLEPFNRKILARIFEEHVGIQKLHLTCFLQDDDTIMPPSPMMNKDGHSSKQQKTIHSLNQLPNLEYLSISVGWDRIQFDVFDAVLGNFNYPMLKYLHCSSFCNTPDIYNFLRMMSAKACHLESLSLDSYLLMEINIEIIMYYIRKLKKLRFLRLSCHLELKQIHKLFSTCPSLKIILRGEFGGSTYLCNRFSGTVLPCGPLTAREMCKFANDEE